MLPSYLFSLEKQHKAKSKTKAAQSHISKQIKKHIKLFTSSICLYNFLEDQKTQLIKRFLLKSSTT